MPANLFKTAIEKNRSGQRTGFYSVCSANEIVIRAAIRHAVQNNYPLIIESTSNQVNQFGGYTGMLPHEFISMVQKISREEGQPKENLIPGGDHLGPLLWQNENESSAMEKATDMVHAYTLAGYGKIHIDTSMKLADDLPGPLDIRICARRGAALAREVFKTYNGMLSKETQSGGIQNQPARPALVIGSEVPVPGGSQVHEDSITPTKAADFLDQVNYFREEFGKAGVDFNDVIAFVIQPGVEFGDDHIFQYDPEKAKELTAALKSVSGIVFEGHSTDYQSRENLAALVRDGVAILKVGPALTFALREGLCLLEAIEEITIPEANRSGFKKTLLSEMDSSRKYWVNYYSGTAAEIEYKKLYSYSDRCRYYLPGDNVRNAMNTLFGNIPSVPPALLSQFLPAQYRRFFAGKLNNDPLSLLYDRIADVCADYAFASGFIS